MTPQLRRVGLGLLGVAIVLAIWQFLVTGPWADRPFATLGQIGEALVNFAGDALFWESLLETLKVTLVGLGLAVVVGVALGVVVGQSDAAYRSIRLVSEFVKPIPPIVILPLLVLVLGPTTQMGMTLVFIGGVFILMTQTANGVKDVDPVAVETARSFQMTRWQRLRHLVVPTAFPFVATGIRVMAGASLVIALVSEIVGGAPGLGADLVSAQTGGDYGSTYALVVVFGVLGMLINSSLSWMERRVLFWHPSVRGEVQP